MRKLLVAVGKGEGIRSYEMAFARAGWEVQCIDRSQMTLDEVLDAVEQIAEEKLIDLVTIDGLSMVPVGDYCRAKGVPVFGVDSRNKYLEQNKGLAKAVLEEYGVPVSKYMLFDDDNAMLDKLTEVRKTIGFPCYMKSLDGYGFKTSYRVERPTDVVYLYHKYDYKAGFLLEQLQRGQEIVVNFMINETGAQVVGCGYEIVAHNEEPTSDVCTWLSYSEYARLFPMTKLQAISQVFGRYGFKGNIGYNGFFDPATGQWTCVEMNARVGYGSGLVYALNIVNWSKIIEAVANDWKIPAPVYRNRYSAMAVVHAKYFAPDGSGEYPCSLENPRGDATYMENNVHGGRTDGKAPYLVGATGEDLYAVTSYVYQATKRVALPLKAVDKIPTEIFELLGIHRLGGCE